MTALRSPFPPQLAAVVDAPAEETLVSKSVELTVVAPRVSAADSPAEVVMSPAPLLSSPPAPIPEVKREQNEVILVPDSPARARSPSPAGGYRRAYRQIRQQNQSFLRQLRFWAETVRVSGDERSRSIPNGSKVIKGLVSRWFGWELLQRPFL